MGTTDLKKYFLFLLAKKDYPESKLRQKALLKNYLVKEIEEALTFLKENRLLNEDLLAKNSLHSYQNQGKSLFYIKQKLLASGLQKESIQKAMAEATEKPSFAKLLTKIERKFKIKMSNWSDLDSTIKLKIKNFLYFQQFQNIDSLISDLAELSKKNLN